MLNQCQFIGNLGADPEVRTFQNGGRVVNLRLAVSEKWKDRETGEKKERTEWVQIAIFAEHIAKTAEAYLKKGSRIYVSGQLATRKWQDQSGNDRYSTEVVLRPFKGELTMLDGRSEGGGNPDNRSSYDQGGTGGAPAGGALGDDSEIPF